MKDVWKTQTQQKNKSVQEIANDSKKVNHKAPSCTE